MRRGVFAAATLVFLAGSAGAGGVSGGFRGGWGRSLGSFCKFGAFREVRERREVVFDAFALEAALAILRTCGCSDDFFDVADAEIGEVGSFGEDFVARDALGLEAAEFGGCLIKKTACLGAGAVDRGLAAVGGVVVEGGEGGFDEAAAAEAPHGCEDFFDEVLFHEGGGAEFGLERLFEIGVEGLFSGADQGAGGEEAGGEGVLGGGGLAFFGGGAGGGLGVGGVGGELGGGGHGFVSFGVRVRGVSRDLGVFGGGGIEKAGEKVEISW